MMRSFSIVSTIIYIKLNITQHNRCESSFHGKPEFYAPVFHFHTHEIIDNFTESDSFIIIVESKDLLIEVLIR